MYFFRKNLQKQSLKMRSISNIHVLSGITPINKSRTQQFQPAERKRCVSYYEKYRPPPSGMPKNDCKHTTLLSKVQLVLAKESEDTVMITLTKEKVKPYGGMDDFLPQYEKNIEMSSEDQKMIRIIEN